MTLPSLAWAFLRDFSMSNSYFQFKQFRIDQHFSALKVGTDGVLLGSWCDVEDAKMVLDIGCGTGLIALMVAQRNPDALIKAIDISSEAIKDCEANFYNSPWQQRVTSQEISLQEFCATSMEQFDLIVCNPPYFKNSLKSEKGNKNLARHDDSLPFSLLLELVSSLLSAKGRLSIIIPFERADEAIAIAKINNLNLSRNCSVFSTTNSPEPIRSLLEFRKTMQEAQVETLSIEIERHRYTDEYIQLTKEFYLKM